MKKWAVANWKMFGRRADVLRWLTEVRVPTADFAGSVSPPVAADSVDFAGGVSAAVPADSADGGRCVLCPPLPYLSAAAENLPAGVALGAQNVAAGSDDAARTGEVSAAMLADVGCGFVIVGHSERREFLRESDAMCATKLAAAVAAGLRPILCVGESAAQHDAGEAKATVIAQVAAATADATDSLWARLLIAYEPIWAIGSGQTPEGAAIDTMHTAIRRHLREKTAKFDKIPVLYGGSVNPSNIGSFAQLGSVDGFLIGGASLDAAKMTAMCNILENL